MAISASTISKDRQFRKGSDLSLFETIVPLLSSAITFNQGDILCYDTGTDLIRAVASTADAATVLGVAADKIVTGNLAGPYDGLATTGQQKPQEARGPIYGNEMSMKLKTGDAFVPGGKVYLADGADCQTVSSTDPGDHNYVGVYTGAAVASAAAGQEGPCRMGCRYPDGTGAVLKF